MEFPHIGQHCHYGSCNRLDFLPVKCDACQEVFCGDHLTYVRHQCPSAYKKDVQVPVCPLCNRPVPTGRDEVVDVKVNEHIDRFCQSDPAVAKRKVYANRCSVKGCKRKELVPITCASCRQNFCLGHRNELDHKCEGFAASGRPVSNSGAAAVSRVSQKAPQKNAVNVSQSPISVAPNAQLTEDEALAMALQLSLADTSQAATSSVNAENTSSNIQEQNDRALALALEQSEREYTAQHSNAKKNCIVT